MKYLIIPLALLIAGCTSDSDSSSSLMSELRDVKYELQSCKASLEAKTAYEPQPSTYETPPEPEPPPEPQCEDIDYLVLYQDGKVVATCRDVKETTCGISAEQCTNNYSYNCLTNVKFGSETKKVCE